ncbi:MAG: glycosyltransferase family 4 protein [Candidatus Omnitrophica bacterium]|nr:glycosyltransferase family 4 protein [Candidatus Omnitrophota bacterium]
MNILYICPRFPYPPNQGDKVVIYNHLKFLSKNNKITLLTLIKDERELNGIPNLSQYCVSIETFKKRPNFSIWDFIMAIFKTDPFTVIRYYSPEMLARSKALIESAKFDIIHVSQYYMGQYVLNKNIAIPKTTATIFDTHHIQYLIYLKFAGVVKNPILKLFAFLEALRIKDCELPMYKKFDRCLAVSESDKEVMERLSGASNISVSPFCMELCSVDAVPQQNESEEENTIIFFGTFASLPNIDGLLFFYKSIFPLIKKEIPTVKFIIAGDNPPRLAQLANDPNVKLAGVVSNIRDYLNKIAVVVVPLRVIGGGLTIKILESWAAGKAVVATSAAIGGIQITNGSDIVVADCAGDFANEVVKLLKDKSKRRALGKAAIEKVREYYNPSRVIENLEKIYRDARQEKIQNG